MTERPTRGIGEEIRSEPLVSIVVPVYNGVDVVSAFHSMLSPVADRLDGGAEILFVDDGSRDGTLQALRSIQERDTRVRVIELAANFGQHAALFAGFAHARGEHLVTMDVDLQCDPRDIPRLLGPLSQGHDLACGVRVGRRDPAARRFFSWVLNGIVRHWAGTSLRDAGCSFNGLTRELARELAAYGEFARFGKPLAVRLARQATEVDVKHGPGHMAASRYSATALVRFFMDFIATVVGDLFAWVFLTASFLALVLGLATVAAGIAAVVTGASAVPMMVAGALCIVAVVTALLGLVGDLIRRTHRQTSGMPLYLVRRVHEPGSE